MEVRGWRDLGAFHPHPVHQRKGELQPVSSEEAEQTLGTIPHPGGALTWLLGHAAQPERSPPGWSGEAC